MSTTPSRLSHDGDSPQGASAGDVAPDRPARAEKQLISIGFGDRPSTPPPDRFADRVVFHLVRIFGLTLAALLLFGLLAAAGLRIAAADHPNPWSVVQFATAEALGKYAWVIAGLSAAAGLGLGLLVLVVFLVLLAVGARVPRGPARPTHPSPRT